MLPQLTDTFVLHNDFDVVMARQRAREISRNLGFGLTDQTRIATAVSEVARRALANQGSVSLAVISDGPRRGIECTCQGCSPPTGGVSPGEFLGGLQGVAKLMDEFAWIDAKQTVVMRKWLKRNFW